MKTNTNKQKLITQMYKENKVLIDLLFKNDS